LIFLGVTPPGSTIRIQWALGANGDFQHLYAKITRKRYVIRPRLLSTTNMKLHIGCRMSIGSDVRRWAWCLEIQRAHLLGPFTHAVLSRVYLCVD